MAIKRVYGKEQTIGDIVYNTQTKTIFFKIDLGFMGSKNVELVLNNEGTYDMFGTYYDSNSKEYKKYSIGKTFPVKDNQNNILDYLTKGSIGLRTSWNKDLKKVVTSNEDALFITTHKLKEKTQISDNLIKVGWVTGSIGIEAEQQAQTNNSTYDNSLEEVPM